MEQGELYKSMKTLHLESVDHEGWMDSPQQTQLGNISKPIPVNKVEIRDNIFHVY